MANNARLRKIRFYALFALLVLSPLSKLPSIGLPVLNFPSFRIGVPQVAALCLSVSSAPLLLRMLRTQRDKKSPPLALFLLAFSAITLSTLLGVILEGQALRSLLYGGSLLFLMFVGASAYAVFSELDSKKKSFLLYSVVYMAAIFSVLALLQLVLATFADKDAFSTLCSGCSDTVLGFPRINLFAAEPQFFANSLLPAFFISLILPTKKTLPSLALISVALALTFSRGAYIALFITACGLVVWFWHHKKPFAFVLKRILLSGFFLLVGFLLLVSSATFIHRSEPGITEKVVKSMVEQLSVGRIHFTKQEVPGTTALTTTDSQKATNIDSNTPQESFTPSGYVEASTSDRKNATKLAIDAWWSTPRTVFFGVGPGNFGRYINKHINPNLPSNFTVYVMYALLLVEIGLLPLALLLGLTFYSLYFLWKQKTNSYAVGIFLALLLHFFFFGSYINSIGIWTWFGVCSFTVLSSGNKHKKVV